MRLVTCNKDSFFSPTKYIVQTCHPDSSFPPKHECMEVVQGKSRSSFTPPPVNTMGDGRRPTIQSPDTLPVTSSAPPASPVLSEPRATLTAATPVRADLINDENGHDSDPFRTPLATTTDADMVTPDNELSYTHGDDMNPDFVPVHGMCFTSEEDAKLFYCRYAEKAGFGIVMGNNKMFSRVMKCSNSGKGEFYRKGEACCRRKTSKKTCCKSYIKLKKIYDSNREVTSFMVEYAQLKHNHPLDSSSGVTKQMRSHKRPEPVMLQFIDEMQTSGVPHENMLNMISDMHGGEENVPITLRDLENRKAANVCAERANDINRLIEFFHECREQKPHFYWDFDLDTEGFVKSVFWSHASMQGEYADFGDVVTFDTTHQTNIYDKPLAMFVGANNHLQNTLFACALVGDETAETFKWVFQKFRQCMGGVDPRCMLTDQDSAMAIAMKAVFPRVIHRLCRWHVLNKHMPQLNELYALYEAQDFKDKFHSVINHPLTRTEFESAWHELLNEFNLHENPTLESLYAIRDKWVPALLKPAYCGRMASTQRSESMNFIVKKCFVDNQTPLHSFAKKMVKVVHRRKMAESTETYGGMSRTETDGKWPFEVKLSRIYTRKVFDQFENSMKLCTAYRIEDDKNECQGHYLVTHTNRSSKISWGQHQFRVYANVASGEYTCECKHWEHTGLLCMHLLRTFIQLQLEAVPGKYVLKRYTRNARNGVAFDRRDFRMAGQDGETQSYRTKMLLTKGMAVVRAASMSKAGYKKAMEELERLFKLLENLEPDIGGNGCEHLSDDEGVNNSSELVVTREVDVFETHQARKEHIGSVHVPEVGSLQETTTSLEQTITRKTSLVIEHPPRGIENGGREFVEVHMEDRVNVEQDDRLTGRIIGPEETHINRQPPPRSKPKGRRLKEAEKKVLQLGVKGEKKRTRKCLTCGLKTGHNSATCPSIEKNQIRIKELGTKKRGRPPGSRNRKIVVAVAESEGKQTAVTTRSTRRKLYSSEIEDDEEI